MTMKSLKYAIIFFYLALFVFLALHDERLDPELVRALAVPHPKVIERGNAWLAMLDLDAPPLHSLRCSCGILKRPLRTEKVPAKSSPHLLLLYQSCHSRENCRHSAQKEIVV